MGRTLKPSSSSATRKRERGKGRETIREGTQSLSGGGRNFRNCLWNVIIKFSCAVRGPADGYTHTHTHSINEYGSSWRERDSENKTLTNLRSRRRVNFVPLLRAVSLRPFASPPLPSLTVSSRFKPHRLCSARGYIIYYIIITVIVIPLYTIIYDKRAPLGRDVLSPVFGTVNNAND